MSGTAGTAGSGAYGGSGGVPDIPSGTGTGTGDLDAIFDKSLGDFDGGINGEREVIASSGGGSSKGVAGREQGDAKSVSDGSGMSTDGSMPDTGNMDGGQGTSGAPMGGASSDGGDGGEGTYSGDEQREGGELDEADRDGQKVILPDDIPIDGSGDDVVGRQIREAAIAMQAIDPKAAEALWDEYRKHTGIK
jgi:hypothetical protein